MFNKMSDVPEEVMADVLDAMGEVVKEAQYNMGKRMKIWDPDWNGTHILDSIKVNKPKFKNNVATIVVTFKGTRTRGNTTTRNAEIAFMNEFGVPKKKINAKPFIKTANALSQEKAFQAGEKVWHDYLDNL